jgi:hypothetical protein
MASKQQHLTNDLLARSIASGMFYLRAFLHYHGVLDEFALLEVYR